MQNGFTSGELSSRSGTPSLGFASSSSHLSSMQYNAHLSNFQAHQQPHQSGFASPMSGYGTLNTGVPNFNGFPINSQHSTSSLPSMNTNNNFIQQQSSFNPMMTSMSTGSPMVSHASTLPQQMLPLGTTNPMQMGVPNLVSNWNYIDVNNEVRGPFTSMQMDSWFTGGYLNLDLRICHISCSPMNPFDDMNVPLSYPYGLNSTSYVTLKEFLEMSNASTNQKVFFNFDCLCTMIMKDFLNRGFSNLASAKYQPPQQTQPTPQLHQNPVQQLPVTNAVPAIPKPTNISKLLDLDSLSKISSNEELSNLNVTHFADADLKNNDLFSAKQEKKPKEKPLSFKEALALKTPTHPNSYNHIQRKRIAVQPLESKISRIGVYNSNYYSVSDYSYSELFTYGMKDSLNNECKYIEHVSYMPIGKVVDDVIETDDWPAEFYSSKDDTDEDLAIRELPSDKQIPEILKVYNQLEVAKASDYFARVHSTRLQTLPDAGPNAALPTEIAHGFSSLILYMMLSVKDRTPRVDGSIITYLSKINPSVLKKILIVIRIIFTSQLPFFSSMYDFVAENFIGLYPETEIIFDKTVDILDFPYDATIFMFLLTFVTSICAFKGMDQVFVYKAMEILKYYDAKRVPYKTLPSMSEFLNSPEYKKAKIDFLILKIDDQSEMSKKKKKQAGTKDAAKSLETKLAKIDLNVFKYDLPISYYLTKGLDPRMKKKNNSYKPLPLFFWSKHGKRNTEYIKIEEPLPTKQKQPKVVESELEKMKISDDLVNTKKDVANSATKKNVLNSKTKSQVNEKATNIPVEPSTKTQKNVEELYVKQNPSTSVKKEQFKWESNTESVKTPSILDIITKKEEEEKKLKEAKKLQPVKVYEPSRDFIRESILKEEKEKANKKNLSGAPWINDKEVSKSEGIDAIREVMAQPTKKNKAPVLETASRIIKPPVVVKKNSMPETYKLSNSTPKSSTSDPLAQLLEEKKKPSKPKEKSPTPVFNEEFIKEQEKLLKDLELKKKNDDAQWVTVDKKQIPKTKKVIKIVTNPSSAILDPAKLRKIAAPKVSATASQPLKSTVSQPAVDIPSSSQKVFLQWCQKNLGDSDFLSILFSMDKANISFFVDMVNSTGSGKPKINGKTATEFFKVKDSFESARGFLSWHEALTNLNGAADDWSFQTVKKKK